MENLDKYIMAAGFAPGIDAGSPRKRSDAGLRQKARCPLMMPNWTVGPNRAGAQNKGNKPFDSAKAIPQQLLSFYPNE